MKRTLLLLLALLLLISFNPVMSFAADEDDEEEVNTKVAETSSKKEYMENITLSAKETAIIFIRYDSKGKGKKAYGNIAKVEPKTHKLDFIGSIKGGQGVAYIMPSGSHEFVITSDASYGNVLKGNFEAGRYYYVPIETVKSKVPYILFANLNDDTKKQRIFADAIKKVKYVIPSDKHIKIFNEMQDNMKKQYKDSLEATDSILYGDGVVEMPANSGLKAWVGSNKAIVNRIK